MTSIREHKKHDKQAEKTITKVVEKYGWFVALFEADEKSTSFAYTIGLWKKYKHPEIIAFGLSTKTLHKILNNAGEKIKEGKSLLINQEDYDILENAPVIFVTVDAEKHKEYLGYGMWFNDYKEFPVLQLVWPDRQNNFPWHQEFEAEFISKQPVLNKEFSK